MTPYWYFLHQKFCPEILETTQMSSENIFSLDICMLTPWLNRFSYYYSEPSNTMSTVSLNQRWIIESTPWSTFLSPNWVWVIVSKWHGYCRNFLVCSRNLHASCILVSRCLYKTKFGGDSYSVFLRLPLFRIL